MRSLLFLLSVLCFLSLTACKTAQGPQRAATGLKAGQLSPFDDIQMADDPGYGFSAEMPVEVGGYATVRHEYQYEFMSNLRGPNGEKLSMHRVGSCCPFPSPNGINGVAVLDVWSVTMPDGAERQIYISSYDFVEPRVPVGFSYLGLPEVIFGNEIQQSFNQVVLQRVAEVDLDDGVEQEEAVTLAQFNMISSGRSASHDLEAPKVVDVSGIFFVAFAKRGEDASQFGEVTEEWMDAVFDQDGALFMISSDGMVSEFARNGESD